MMLLPLSLNQNISVVLLYEGENVLLGWGVFSEEHVEGADLLDILWSAVARKKEERAECQQ